MKLDYIYHSGFAIEADGITVIIDYYKDSSEEAPDRGIVHDHLLKKPGTLYVLSSHFHPDHFNRDILSWKEQRPDIRYIFSKDILKSHRAKPEDATYIKKGETYEDETIRIEAFGSTDVGSSFLLHLQDWSIFHAGDLNWWHWEEEDDAYNRMMRGDYQKEIETLAGEKIDLAFVVLDPRQEEQFYWGFDWYMRHTDTKIVFPMHMWKQYEVQDRLIGMEVSEPYREKIMRIREMGQVFEL